MATRIYLSLGSNLGDRAAHLRNALARLGQLWPITTVSSFYETEPVEVTKQPWFLNCAAALETNDTPERVLTVLLHIEEHMGRRRTQKKGPRLIDMDILLFGDRVIHDPDLKVPHPAMHLRRFVLEPMAEIAPDVQHPILKKTMLELRDALPAGQAVRRFTE